MIQFGEIIYGRFLHHQSYESVDVCNYLFAVCCFVLLLLLKLNETEIQITKYYVRYKVMVEVYNPNLRRARYKEY